MDIRQAASYFNSDSFDAYDKSDGVWMLNNFYGNLKYASESFTVNELGSRKRMLFTAPDKGPTTSVIRASQTEDIFMVNTQREGLFNNSRYINTMNVHQITGTAEIWRRAPTGPSNDPGWATNVKVEDTFYDANFGRGYTDQENNVDQLGLYTLYMPYDANIKLHDTVVTPERTFYLFDTYEEQGLKSALATDKPDPRIDAVYVKRTVGVYDPSFLVTPITVTNYNVTLQIKPFDLSEIAENVVTDAIKVLIDKDWIGVVPALNDQINVLSKTYTIVKVSQDIFLSQWVLECHV